MSEPWHMFVYRVGNCDLPIRRQSATLFSIEIESLVLDPAHLRSPFEMTFDTTRERIENEPGGYCEGDGAFGWHPPHDSTTHLCGTIHCVDERIVCIELHANLTQGSWSRLIEILGLDHQIAIQFPELGIFIESETLRNVLPAV